MNERCDPLNKISFVACVVVLLGTLAMSYIERGRSDPLPKCPPTALADAERGAVIRACRS